MKVTTASDAIKIAQLIRDVRYPDSVTMFAAGSMVRGEATPYSDLDLVVVYAKLPHAYRESYRFQSLPIEAFVHDPETMSYFFSEVDGKSGIPSLARMVSEGVEIPLPSDTSCLLKELAASMLAAGPPLLSAQEVESRRYLLTDLMDDIRAPKSRGELTATGTRLFEALADYHLRVHGYWSGKGKGLSRALKQADANLSERYFQSFDTLFSEGDPTQVLALGQELLQPHGGAMFEGFRLDAPTEWRKPIPPRKN